MRVGCIICSDAFLNFIEVSATPCGHTFHTHCIMQWIETSKSCPTCRHKATIKNTLKLFFDATGSESTTQVDPDSLQNQIDSLKFQVVEKEQILRNYKEDNSVLSKQTKGLREECKKLEQSLKDKEMSVSAYKDQLRYVDNLVKNASKAEEDAKKAKSQLKLLKHIQTIVEDNEVAIEDTIMSNSQGSNMQENIKGLATMSCVLKSRVNKLLEEKRRNDERFNCINLKLKEAKRIMILKEAKIQELQKNVTHLEEDIQSLERENKSLSKKVSALQDSVISPSADARNSAIYRLISESPAPIEIKRTASQSIDLDHTPQMIRKFPRITSDFIDLDTSTGPSLVSKDAESPYLQIKSSSINPLSCGLSSRSTLKQKYVPHTNLFKSEKSSLLLGSKVPGSTSNKIIDPSYPGDDIGYDGLGGHHKVDYFPKPFSNNTNILKKKAKNMKIITNRGTSNISQKVIENFFKNTFSDD